MGSTRRRQFRFFSYRAAAVKAVVDCVCAVCGSGTGKWMGVDSGWVRCFGGETGVGFERFEEPLEVKRDLLEGFIVY